MPFNEDKTRVIKECLNRIKGRKRFEEQAASYKDSADLKELQQIVDEQLLLEKDFAALSDSIAILCFVAEAYYSMGRAAISAKVYTRSVELMLELKEVFGKVYNNADEVLCECVRMRNYYVNDDCDDIIAVAVKLLGESGGIQIEKAKGRRSRLKHDPIEMSDEYLAVIDEVDEIVEKSFEFKGLGSCHGEWALRRKLLLERGIKWRSPAVMNPMVRFD